MVQQTDAIAIEQIRQQTSCFGRYHFRAHACAYDDNNGLCIACRTFTMSDMGRKGGRPKATTLDDTHRRNTVAAGNNLREEKGGWCNTSFRTLLRRWKRHPLYHSNLPHGKPKRQIDIRTQPDPELTGKIIHELVQFPEFQIARENDG